MANNEEVKVVETETTTPSKEADDTSVDNEATKVSPQETAGEQGNTQPFRCSCKICCHLPGIQRDKECKGAGREMGIWRGCGIRDCAHRGYALHKQTLGSGRPPQEYARRQPLDSVPHCIWLVL